MSRYYEGNLAKKLSSPDYISEQAKPRVKRFRKRKVSLVRLGVMLIVVPILVACLGVCYTAKRTEIAATTYQLDKINRELEAIKDEKSRLEVSILTRKAEIDFSASVANDIAMRTPTVEDVSLVQ
jgi:hypothetical protein